MILRIKEVMKEKGISRNEVAEKVEVSPATISNICTEKSYPSIPLLTKLADVLNVDIRELLISTKPGKIEEAKKLIEDGLKKLG